MRTRRTGVRACGALLALVFAAAPLVARAEEEATGPKEKARDLVARANKAFKRAQYQEAADAFLEAYRVIEANGLTPKPELLYNAGLAFERLDQCDKTAEMFEKFLSAKPSAATPDLKYRLKKAEECAPEIEITTDPGGAKVIIDGTERGVSPLSTRIPSGAHRLRLDLEGYAPIEEEVAVDPKTPQPIVRSLKRAGVAAREEAPARPEVSNKPIAPVTGATDGALSTPVSPQPESPWLRRWAWVAGGAGIAAIGTGVVLAILSQNAISRRDAEIAKGTSVASDQVVRNEESTAEALAIGRDVAIGAGALSLVASGVLLFVAGKNESGSDSGDLAVTPLPGGAKAAWRITW